MVSTPYKFPNEFFLLDRKTASRLKHAALSSKKFIVNKN